MFQPPMSVFSRRRYLAKIVRTVGPPAAKLAKLELALSALDAESPEGKCLKNLVDKTRGSCGAWPSRQAVGLVSAVSASSKKAFGDGKLWSPLSPSRIGCKRVQHWGREIGGLHHLTSGGDGQQHWENPTPRSVGRRAPQREGRSAIKRSRVEASRGGWP